MLDFIIWGFLIKCLLWTIAFGLIATGIDYIKEKWDEKKNKE